MTTPVTIERSSPPTSHDPGSPAVESKGRARLVKLYAEMSRLTAPECASCRCPHSCCDAMYCEQAISWAKEHWQVDLPRTNGKNHRGEVLPLMGEHGCTAPPHLRPICTVHTCAISGLGFKQGDPKWTARYFKLRARLEDEDLFLAQDMESGAVVAVAEL